MITQSEYVSNVTNGPKNRFVYTHLNNWPFDNNCRIKSPFETIIKFKWIADRNIKHTKHKESTPSMWNRHKRKDTDKVNSWKVHIKNHRKENWMTAKQTLSDAFFKQQELTNHQWQFYHQIQLSKIKKNSFISLSIKGRKYFAKFRRDKKNQWLEWNCKFVHCRNCYSLSNQILLAKTVLNISQIERNNLTELIYADKNR